MFGRNDHVKVVKTIAEGMKAAGNLGTYLELGVKKAACFNEVAPLAKEAFAVDINPCSKYVKEGLNRQLFWMSTDTFFESTVSKGERFDLIFIDADHSHEASLKDFENSLKHLNDNGLILLHDTYPPGDEYKVPGYCHDCYKTAEYIYKNICNVEMVTLPFYYGITIVRKI